MTVESDKKKLREWIKKFLPEDYDKIDVEGEYDSSLSLSENKEHFREILKSEMKTLKEKVEEQKAMEEQLRHERIIEAEREAEEWNDNLVFDDVKDLEKYYERIYNGVEKLASGHSNLLFVKGRAGLGKSRNIRKALKQSKTQFIEITGDVTEAYLYRLIFENNGKIIWLKEVANLLVGQKSMNLLKSATETEEKRILTKSNYSKVQEDLPNHFACKSKFIFDYNNLPRTPLRDDFEALISRGDYIELAFCQEEIENILRLISKEDWQKEVAEFLISEYNSTGMHRLNIRTLIKSFQTYKYAKDKGLDWKSELKSEFKNISGPRAIIYTMIGNRVVRTTELKKQLLKHGVFNSLRTVSNKINEWLITEELYPHSVDGNNILVGINPHPEIRYSME